MPKPSAAPAAPPEAHLEELAAAALMEAPGAPRPPAEEPKTIDFNCPQCDEPVQLSAELQGKQTPCPHCSRIIKVPFRVKNEPKDWRMEDTRMPSGARRAEEPAPEGAWGSATASTVSRQALLQTSGPRRRALTLRQKLIRGGFLAGCVLVAGLATWIGFSMWGQRQQKQGYAKAMILLKAEDNKLSAEARGALYTQAAVCQLRSESSAGTREARDQFQQARKLLSAAPDSVDRELLLADLALLQIELGGDSDQAAHGLRVKWDDTAGEVRQTLQQLHDPEARGYALRQVCRRLIEKNQTDKIPTLAMQLSAAFNADAKAAAPGPAEDAPELLGVAGLELLRASQMDAAKKLAGQGLALYKPNGAAANPPVSTSLVALCIAVDSREELPKPAKPDDEANLVIGMIQGTAWGDLDRARQLAGQVELPDTRGKALVALAAAGKDKPDATALRDALRIAQLSPWWSLQMIDLAASAGLDEEALAHSAKSIPDAAMSGRASLIVLRAKLGRTEDKAEIGWAEAVNKNSTSSGVAYLDVARHNARRKALSVKDVDVWEENVRPFGYLGVALGRQDAE